MNFLGFRLGPCPCDPFYPDLNRWTFRAAVGGNYRGGPFLSPPLINIGMNGVSLKVDSEGFWVASEVPLQVVSSSVGGRPRRDQPYPQRGSAG